MLLKTASELNNFLNVSGRGGKTLGFVPTMGSLHEGHLSLIRAAKASCGLVIVSVFVNPTQFGPNEDFTQYPRDLDRDCRLAFSAGADAVFSPDVDEIYPPGAGTTVDVSGALSETLCGASRPGHFKGVATVVTILLNIVRPDTAYFGQKDAQQALLIKKMVRDLHMPVSVLICPIVREEDGLAMSSRNIYLSPDERREAVCLNAGLQKAADYLRSGQPDAYQTDKLVSIIKNCIKAQPLANIDYVEIRDSETLTDIREIAPGKTALAAVAVRFGKTRLIDNRLLTAD
ncbi:pantoate--beta-alanine ligase [Oscillospiraceae bacterium CM]|nr:pantoate--beta-alanine ligase [Oscillospiraceae bacterium CM]